MAGASLSLTSISQEKEEETVIEVHTDEADVPALTEESAASYWSVLSSQFPDKPRLANALASSKLTLSEEDGCQVVTFTVTNEAQKSWIAANLLHALELRFRKISSNHLVRLSVEAAEFVEEKVIYTAEDKVRDLIEKQPEVVELINDLDLDIR